MTEAWGEPEADPAFHNGAFHFPCVRAGNITILIQPDRGSAGARKQGYHDAATPPRHVYVALYAWLREAERIDAMIHLGTHGTLEWLPGKAVALAARLPSRGGARPSPRHLSVHRQQSRRGGASEAAHWRR